MRNGGVSNEFSLLTHLTFIPTARQNNAASNGALVGELEDQLVSEMVSCLVGSHAAISSPRVLEGLVIELAMLVYMPPSISPV